MEEPDFICIQRENEIMSDTISHARHAFLGAKNVFSPIFHFTLFGLRRHAIQFEKGMFITSIDVDVGNEKLGVINKGKYDRQVTLRGTERFVGEVEQRNVPLLLNLFEDLEIPVTFAFRGQLFDVDTSLPKLVMSSPIKHEIGSHGYYHREFTRLPWKEADEELKMTTVAMKKLGVIPKSFIFPRNAIAHLDLLKKHGYVCYRGMGGFTKDDNYIRSDHHGLYDVHPSFFLGWNGDPFFVKRTVDICARRKLPFHLWFHPRDLGDSKDQAQKRIERMLSPLLRHARKNEKGGTLTFETMFSATKKAALAYSYGMGGTQSSYG